MMRNRWLGVLGALCVLAVGSGAQAQDPEVGDYESSASGSVSASASASRPRSSSRSSSGGTFLEMQARVDAFSVAGVEGFGTDSGNGGVTYALPAIPFTAFGVRLLDQQLFVGLGIGFGSIKARTEPPSPAPEIETRRNAFMLSPLATFDILQRAAAALYVMAILKLGVVGGGEDDPGDDPEGAFWFGMSGGAGIRGDITDNVGAFTEFGWTFSRGGWEVGDTNNTRFVHGLFGVLGISLRIGV